MKNVFILNNDSQYINHSNNDPTITFINPTNNIIGFDGYAKRNIKKGEEITEDYRESLETYFYYPQWFVKLCDKYDFQDDFIEYQT